MVVKHASTHPWLYLGGSIAGGGWLCLWLGDWILLLLESCDQARNYYSLQKYAEKYIHKNNHNHLDHNYYDPYELGLAYLCCGIFQDDD